MARPIRSLLLAVLFFWPWPVRAVAAGDLVPQSLMQKAQQHGAVLVIVEVNVPSVPEATFHTAADVAGQRTAIRMAQDSVVLAVQASGARVRHQYVTAPYIAMEAPLTALYVLATLSGQVVRVLEDVPAEPHLSTSVPLVGAPSLWAIGLTGSGSVIAVLDTGVDSTHPFLAGRIVAEACFSAIGPGAQVSVCPNGQEVQVGPGSGGPCALANCLHGTHVAGIAAGNGSAAAQAFSGVAPAANIMSIQVFSRTGASISAFSSDTMRALEHVYLMRNTYKIAAANMSLGGGRFSANCDSDPHKPFVDNLRGAGIPVVASSGNESYVGSLASPACISTVVSVGATNKQDGPTSYSNISSFLSLLAPGHFIRSSIPGGGYAETSGTSMAAPHVAGAFALLRQGAPWATVTEMLVALQVTGVPVNDTGFIKPRIQVDQAHVTVPAAVFVGSFYEEVLGRQAERSGALSWTAFLRANCHAGGFSAIAHAFFDSSEFRNRPLTLNALVTVLYRTFLGRDPEPAGLGAWAAVFRHSRVSMALGSFIPSAEFQNLVPDRTNANLVRPVITRLYVEVLGRQPEPAGLAGWVNYVVASGDLEGAALAFITSPEFEQRPLTFAGFVRVLYRAFLGREPDPAGSAAWELVLRQHLLGVIDSGFIPSGEFQSQIPVVCGA